MALQTAGNNTELKLNRCRVCLREAEHFNCLFDYVEETHNLLHFANILAICCNIQVTRNDKKPQKICQNCVDSAKVCFKFKTTCERSENILNKELSNVLSQCKEELTVEEEKIFIPCESASKEPTTTKPIAQKAAIEESVTIKTEEQDEFDQDITMQEDMNTEINLCEVSTDSEEAQVENILIKCEDFQDESLDQEDVNLENNFGESSNGSKETQIRNAPAELDDVAGTTLELLPEKTRTIYEKQYTLFMDWCRDNKIEEYTEHILLTYFSTMSVSWKPSTLWRQYSILKSTLAYKNKVYIGKYTKLVKFLKEQNIGYQKKTTKVFTRNDVNAFLRYAPDEVYLLMKVCLLIGVSGSVHQVELRKMTIDDIDDKGNIIIITIPDSKNGKKRIFTLTDENYDGINPLELIRKYVALRPRNCQHNNFFINYRAGKCYPQVIGINSFAKIPSNIAKYLRLPNENAYTGHCFRRTSASLLSDSRRIFRS